MKRSHVDKKKVGGKEVHPNFAHFVYIFRVDVVVVFDYCDGSCISRMAGSGYLLELHTLVLLQSQENQNLFL
jgi:hypothetical protein